MKSYKVTGAGGVQLHVEETGNQDGRAILFIHGLSQSRLSWAKQMRSELATDFRLVAFDIRGHGLSEKPRDSYGDSKLWADDIQAIIQTLKLNQPVLCGWSYGSIIICDYIRHHGEAQLGGMNFVGATSRLGEPVLPFASQKFLELGPGLFSNEVEESMSTLQKFVRLAVYDEPSLEDFYLVLGFNAIVPPYVRAGLLGRTVDNDDLLSQIRKPLLITHGEDDQIILPEMARHHAARISQAQVSFYPRTGHAPFWENAERFNAELRSFMASIETATSALEAGSATGSS